MSADLYQPRFDPAYRHSTSHIAMYSPRMTQLFYCHQEQWIQYFATARNIPESMVSFAPSQNNFQVVIKNSIVSNNAFEKVHYNNYFRRPHQYPHNMIKAGQNRN